MSHQFPKGSSAPSDANDTIHCFYFRISEASKAFQMEKIENGYENMSHFTVNLNREEKIIREIDFYRGKCFFVVVAIQLLAMVQFS